MLRKVFRSGNSIVLALPKEMVDALGLAEGQDVSVELLTERQQIVITPHVPEAGGVDMEFARQVADFIQTYKPALEALAK